MKYITVGTVTGLLGFAGTLSVTLGKPALGAFLSDPSTAAAITGVLSGALAL